MLHLKVPDYVQATFSVGSDDARGRFAAAGGPLGLDADGTEVCHELVEAREVEAVHTDGSGRFGV